MEPLSGIFLWNFCVDPFCETFMGNLYLQPLWNLGTFECGTLKNLGEPGVRFPAAAPIHPSFIGKTPSFSSCWENTSIDRKENFRKCIHTIIALEHHPGQHPDVRKGKRPGVTNHLPKGPIWRFKESEKDGPPVPAALSLPLHDFFQRLDSNWGTRLVFCERFCFYWSRYSQVWFWRKFVTERERERCIYSYPMNPMSRQKQRDAQGSKELSFEYLRCLLMFKLSVGFCAFFILASEAILERHQAHSIRSAVSAVSWTGQVK